MSTTDPARDLEIRVLTDVIEAAESLLRRLEATGSTIAVRRPEAVATLIQAVMASARATGHYDPGSLVYAPLLDAILTGADATSWDTAIFTVLVDGFELD
ncbi:hypothetical protein [Nocardia sp. IFM 10818]